MRKTVVQTYRLKLTYMPLKGINTSSCSSPKAVALQTKRFVSTDQSSVDRGSTDQVHQGQSERPRNISCPPYHLAVVIGGTSAEACLTTVKKASAGYYDNLPTEGNDGGQAFRDLEWETKIQKICQDMGIGAQFGGKTGYTTCVSSVCLVMRHLAPWVSV